MPLVFRALVSLDSSRTLVREEATDTGFTAVTYLACGAIGMSLIPLVSHVKQLDFQANQSMKSRFPSPDVGKIIHTNPGVTPFRDDEHTPSHQIAVQK